MKDSLAHSEPVRIDKWLWAARFFKTRSLAAEAINGGKVHVNGTRVKPSKMLTVGMILTITQEGGVAKTIEVTALSDKRGPAVVAAGLYQETAESVQKREQFEQSRKIAGATFYSETKPNKKNRRSIIRFKKGEL